MENRNGLTKRTFFLAALVFWIANVALLKHYCLMHNICVVGNVDSIPLSYQLYKDSNNITDLVPQHIFDNDESFLTDIRETLNYVAHLSPRFESNENQSPYQLLQDMIFNNKGALCSGLALVLRELLIVKGYKARVVQLIRCHDFYDAHSITEVYNPESKRWMIVDPTFNLMLKKDNTYLSAQQVRDIFLTGDVQKIELVFYSAKHKQLFDDYYLNYFTLFNTVLIADDWFGLSRLVKLILKLPIIKYFWGNKIYVQHSYAGNPSYYAPLFDNRLFTVFYLYVPLLLLALFCWILVDLCRKKKRSKLQS